MLLARNSQIYRAVPFELWALIFWHVLPPFWSKAGPARFSSALRRLYDVCQTWRGVLRATKRFWTNFHFHQFGSLEFLETSCACSGSLPLEAVVALTTRSPFHSTSVCDTLLPHLSRCHTLLFSVLDAVSLRLLDKTLGQASLDDLRVLSVSAASSVSRRLSKFKSDMSVHHHLTNLTYLSLRRLSFEWLLVHRFSSLTTLVLRDLIVSPSWTEYQRLSICAPALRRFCLRNVGCSAFPSEPLKRLHFQSMQDLDLCFGACVSSAARLLRVWEVPILHRLRFHGDSPIHFVSFAMCAAILRSVQHFVVSGACDDSFILHYMFLGLHSLHTLDVLVHDHSVLEAIIEADSRLGRRVPSEGPACPHLSSLIVSSASATEVRAFMEGRPDLARHLDQVTVRGGGIWMSDDEDFHWVSSRVMISGCRRYEEEGWVSGWEF
jgi:hypothetical protein